MKKILVACAMGVNTSELLAEKIKTILIEEEGLEVEVEASKVSDAPSLQDQFDLVVSLANIEGLDIPVVIGVDLLTGMDEDGVIEQIKEKLYS